MPSSMPAFFPLFFSKPATTPPHSRSSSVPTNLHPQNDPSSPHPYVRSVSGSSASRSSSAGHQPRAQSITSLGIPPPSSPQPNPPARKRPDLSPLSVKGFAFPKQPKPIHPPKDELHRRVGRQYGDFVSNPILSSWEWVKSPSEDDISAKQSRTSGSISPTQPGTNGEVKSPNRKPKHTPNTGQKEDKVYVLTLLLSHTLAGPMEVLRRRHFPVERNKVPAHISVFRALPESRLEQIKSTLTALANSTSPYEICTSRVMRNHSGVAMRMDIPSERKTRKIWEQLMRQWRFLSTQDREIWRGHWTIMNRVQEWAKIQQAEYELKKLEETKGQVRGLTLWRYEDDGTWTHESDYVFKSGGGAHVESEVTGGHVQDVGPDETGQP
jgi:2'-5' RNA ligase superfamily